MKVSQKNLVREELNKNNLEEMDSVGVLFYFLFCLELGRDYLS